VNNICAMWLTFTKWKRSSAHSQRACMDVINWVTVTD